jgi:hypothetical protein
MTIFNGRRLDPDQSSTIFHGEGGLHTANESAKACFRSLLTAEMEKTGALA